MSPLSPISEKSMRADRAHWLIMISLIGLGACFLRLAYLQLVRGRALEEASENNRTQIVVERAPRGRILDRHGKILSDDQPVWVALFSPLALSPADLQRVLDGLAPILKVPRPELERRLQAALHARAMLRVSDRLSRSQAFLVLQNRVHLPGISLAIEEQRYYPKGLLACHLLGYVGQITDEELGEFAGMGYRPGDWIGKSGLERAYDPLLRGQDGGYLMEVDALGRQVRVIQHVTPQPGKDLVLSVDGALQELAQRRLLDTGHPGAAIVIKAQTGELLALASSPGFDPNLFLPLGKSERRRQLLNDENLPLYNRAIQALYAPASLFKIVTSVAALEEKVMDPGEQVRCSGSYVYGAEKRIFHCWKPHGHGGVSLRAALAQSCDVYFYQLGLKVGPQVLERYARAMGLGQRSGVDLPSEKKGSLPWSAKMTMKQHWQGGDTLNFAIGQGALQVTPLQMADLAAMAANRGVLWQPYLAVAARWGRNEEVTLSAPKVMARASNSDSTWKRLGEGLEEVVRSGTGEAVQIPGVAVAGKTGTAQVPKGREHGWFVAYAPADHPEIACAVLVEHGGHGGSVAAPIAHDLLAMSLNVATGKARAAPSDAQSD